MPALAVCALPRRRGNGPGGAPRSDRGDSAGRKAARLPKHSRLISLAIVVKVVVLSVLLP